MVCGCTRGGTGGFCLLCENIRPPTNVFGMDVRPTLSHHRYYLSPGGQRAMDVYQFLVLAQRIADASFHLRRISVQKT